MILYLTCLVLVFTGTHSTELISLVGASQFHAQDGLGQYSYGYSGGNSAKIESKTADGVTRGGYSYIDANGVLQSVNYVSDPINGFRVAATNLPQAPRPEPVLKVAAIEPIPALKLAPALNFDAAATYPAFKPEEGLKPSEQKPAEFKPSDAKFDPADPKFKPEDLTFKPNDKNNGQYTPEIKFSPLAAAVPDFKSVISTVPALTLSPITVPSLNYSPLALTYPGPLIPLTPFSQLAYSGLPIVPLSFREGELAKVEPKKLDLTKEEENKERSKRSVLYSPLLTTFLSSSQFEVKDNIGNYAYGYQNPLSAKTEVRSFGGLTNGAYSYVDANGFLQSVQYKADSNGFRATGTNFPVA